MATYNYEEAKKLLAQGIPVYVSNWFKDWDDVAGSLLYGEDKLSSYFSMNKEIIVSCHSSLDNGKLKLTLFKGHKVSPKRLTLMMEPILQKTSFVNDKRFFVACCYGEKLMGKKIDGIDVIPLFPSSHAVTDHYWYCDSLGMLKWWYNNIATTFSIEYEFYATRILSDEEDTYEEILRAYEAPKINLW